MSNMLIGKTIADDAKKLNDRIEDNIYKHFLHAEADKGRDLTDKYDSTADWVKADADATQAEIRLGQIGFAETRGPDPRCGPDNWPCPYSGPALKPTSASVAAEIVREPSDTPPITRSVSSFAFAVRYLSFGNCFSLLCSPALRPFAVAWLET
jgi:hypothetical protein